jgi:uncharacterized membrane protein
VNKYLLFFINIVLLVFGQILWKIGSSKVYFGSNIKRIFEILINPFIFTGCLFYFVATILWIKLLSTEELSKLYPLQSLCYVFGIILSFVFLKENLSFNKIIGSIFIVCGAIVIALK